MLCRLPTLLLVRGGASFLQLILLYGFSHLVGLEEVGLLHLYLSGLLWLSCLFGFGLPDLCLRRVPWLERRSPHRRERLVTTLAFLAASLVGGGNALALLSALLFDWLDAREAAPLLGLLVCAAALTAAVRTHAVALIARNRADLAVALELHAPLLGATIFGLGTALLAGKGSVTAAALGQVTGLLAALASVRPRLPTRQDLGVVLAHLVKLARGRRPAARREVLALWANSVLLQGLVALPPLLASLFLSLSALGIFSIVQRLNGLVGTLSAVVAVFYAARIPEAVRLGRHAVRALFAESRKSLIALTLGPLAAFLLVPEDIMRIFAGHGFPVETAGQALALFGLLRIPLLVFGTPELFLRLSGRAHAEAMTGTLGLASLVVLMALLAPGFAASGAAAALGLALLIKQGTGYALLLRLTVDPRTSPRQLAA